MKTKKLVLSLMTLFIFFIPLHAEDMADETVKIVYQCDFQEPKRVNLMLSTINNLVSEYQQNLIDYEIDVVALGPCLQYMMKDFKSTDFKKLPNLEKTQVRFRSLVSGRDNIRLYACENTMKMKKVKPEQILDIAHVTSSGVGKIVHDQLNGYAYIKIY
ncbi:MAG: DsrE family protein [Thiovulaceae bacterium]|nr:DsrE family protein [Sulfurimonadaceae bacterium]